MEAHCRQVQLIQFQLQGDHRSPFWSGE
jgi:hypothetical protein